MSVFSCLFGLGKLVEKSQGPSPVHATDVGNGFATVLYSDDSLRTRSMRDPEVQRLLEDELWIRELNDDSSHRVIQRPWRLF
jgi:hypothetical protein